MDQRLDDLLEEGVQRVVLGGEPLEAFLADYPESRTDLEPLLQMALAVRRAAAIEPTPALRAAIRQRLAAAAEPRRRWWGFLQWQRALAGVAGIILLAGGFGAAAAAPQSLPGDPMYVVKRSLEEVRLVLAFDSEERARQLTGLAQQRSEEQARLAALGRGERVPELEEQYGRYLGELSEVAPKLTVSAAESVGRALMENQERHLKVLAELEEDVPQPARLALKQAAANSERSYRRAREAIERRRGREGDRDGHTPGPTETPEPTETRRLGETPEPTETRRPRETPEPTSRPTETPRPTATEEPGD